MKRIRLFALLVFFQMSATDSRSDVIAGPLTNSSNQHVYYLLSSANWNTLEAQAVALGGHLATIRNTNENFWVWSTFLPLAGSNARLYIGLNDHLAEGSFVWISGETNTFTHWNSGEPNNAGGEDYAVIRPFEGEWNDIDGSLQAFGVAEVPHRQTNNLPFLKIRQINTANVELSWLSTTNQLYQVLWTNSLETNQWSTLGSYIYGNGETLYRTNSMDQTRKFYRLVSIQ